MHKVITILGTRSEATEYTYQGRRFQGKVFAEVLCQLLDGFDQMLVFVTHEAHRKTWPILQSLGDPRIRPIEIPNGETVDEMWWTFDAVTGAVADGDTVTFDITHGLRSIPFLVFLAAAYLKSAKGVDIRAIYYGALQLAKDDGGQRLAPVIELTEFVGLLDWLIASDRMIKLGDASELASLLRASGPTAGQARDDRNMGIQRSNLNRAANALEAVSRSLRLILPDQAMEASVELSTALTRATKALEQQARPFTVLAERVTGAYAQLELRDPRNPIKAGNSLDLERSMIQWYLERGLLVQAAALAREWLVSWMALQSGSQDLYVKDVRDKAEKALTTAINQQRKNHGQFRNRTFPSGIKLKSIPQIEDALKPYQDLGKNRNTLLHAGKQPERQRAEKLEAQTKELCQKLSSLPPPRRQERDA